MNTQQATQELCLKKVKSGAWELWIDDSIFYGTTKTDVLKQLEEYTQAQKIARKLEKRKIRF